MSDGMGQQSIRQEAQRAALVRISRDVVNVPNATSCCSTWPGGCWSPCWAGRGRGRHRTLLSGSATCCMTLREMTGRRVCPWARS